MEKAQLKSAEIPAAVQNANDEGSQDGTKEDEAESCQQPVKRLKLN